ncbi:hypothetical protein ACQWU4_00045 [Chryseobacterium sp. MIQD13]|uniref:hypothetical protein n=1 Tax=Chryseobacterium sp. MIQD13 TaxID=3422310 RepID=UPI003D2A2167
MGTDNAIVAANKSSNIITLDLSDPTGAANRFVKSNTVEVKNYRQTNNPFVGGTQIEPTTGNTTTKITNVKTDDKTWHTTIDNNYRFNVLNEVKKIIPTDNE